MYIRPPATPTVIERNKASPILHAFAVSAADWTSFARTAAGGRNLIHPYTCNDTCFESPKGSKRLYVYYVSTCFYVIVLACEVIFWSHTNEFPDQIGSAHSPWSFGMFSKARKADGS